MRTGELVEQKHAAQWTSTLDMYAGPVFGALPVATIDTGMVVKAIEPLWKTKHETATRLRARIEAVLDWAKVRGFREGENPARWRGHLENILPTISRAKRVQHHPALPHVELPAFLTKLRGMEGIAPRALEFLILTAPAPVKSPVPDSTSSTSSTKSGLCRQHG